MIDGMNGSTENYQSFLLRCWSMPSTSAEEPQIWRFALRDVSAEPTQRSFSSIEALMAYLSAELQQADAINQKPASQITQIPPNL